MKCPPFFSRIFIVRNLILILLRIENAALMRPWGMNSSIPSERLSSSSMDSWPYYRILEAQIVAGSYDSDSSNSLLTCYGSPSDDFLALHHPPHNGPRSTSLCQSDPTRDPPVHMTCVSIALAIYWQPRLAWDRLPTPLVTTGESRLGMRLTMARQYGCTDQ